MATDHLEFQHGLQEIRLRRPIEGQYQRLQVSPRETTEKHGSCGAIDHRLPSTGAGDIGGDDRDEEECRTPSSSDHKIPVVDSCPPAPRKRRQVVSCKRRLSELEFFEIVGRDEIEAFFGSSSCLEFSRIGASAPRNIKKRRCMNK